MTDEEIAALLRSGGPLLQARKKLRSCHGRIEQQSAQGATTLDVFRMEVDGVRAIAGALGITLDRGGKIRAIEPDSWSSLEESLDGVD